VPTKRVAPEWYYWLGVLFSGVLVLITCIRRAPEFGLSVWAATLWFCGRRVMCRRVDLLENQTLFPRLLLGSYQRRKLGCRGAFPWCPGHRSRLRVVMGGCSSRSIGWTDTDCR